MIAGPMWRPVILTLALVAGARPLRGEAAVAVMPEPAVNASRFPGAQHSPALAADPADPTTLVTVATASSGLFAARSTDGGATWSALDQDGMIADGAAGDPLVAACCDPALAWDARGNLFLAYRSAGTASIEIALSTDRGMSFAPLPSSFTGSSLGPPALATGAHAGGPQGAVWLAYAAGNVVVARGALVGGPGVVGAFTAAQAAPGSTGGGIPDLAIGPGGEVVLVYQVPAMGEGPATIRLHRDPNGLLGGGFDAGASAAATNVGGADAIPSQPTAGISASPGLAWDGARGRLYLVFTDEQPDESGDTDVLVQVSLDGGTSFAPAVRVNQDPVGPAQLLPRVAVDRTTGVVAVTWLDARDDPGGAVRPYASLSVDGGTSFTPPVAASSGLSAAVAPADHGTRTALAALPRAFVAAWTDTADVQGQNPDGTAAADVGVVRLAVAADCLDDADCDDGDVCTGAEQCAGTACLPGTPAPDGTPCTDGNACTLHDACAAGACRGGAPLDCAPCLVCDPAAGCTTGLLAGCAPATGQKASAVGVNRRRDGRLRWSWEGAIATSADFGRPTGTTGFELCLYDTLAGVPTLAFAEVVPPAGVCNGRPCWTATRRGFAFRDRDPTPEGLSRLSLRAGRGGRGRIVAEGRGAALALPALPLAVDPRTTMQLRSSAGACWESTYTRTRRNDERRFTARE
jgi:hypothetical protein